MAGVAPGDQLGQAAPELPVPLGELGLGGGVAHGVQRELDHEHAKVAGRGELLLGPAAQGGGQLLGRVDGVQRLDLLELGGHALVQQRQEQLVLVGEVGVDGALGVAGRVGDLVDRGGMEAPTGEHLTGGVEESGTGLLAALRSGQSCIERPRLRKGTAR